MNTSNLQGRTVLVTGAGSGIGRETALLAARRGADLAICDVDDAGLADAEASARALGRRVVARHVDVADREQMREFADTVHDELGVVDVLVNNAGVGLGAGLLETKLEDWDWIVAINIMGVVHGCHLFVPRMVERGTGGHVANLSSLAGFYATPSLVAYSATKFAVLGLSESLREELQTARDRGDRDLPGRHQHSHHLPRPDAGSGRRAGRPRTRRRALSPAQLWPRARREEHPQGGGAQSLGGARRPGGLVRLRDEALVAAAGRLDRAAHGCPGKAVARYRGMSQRGNQRSSSGSSGSSAPICAFRRSSRSLSRCCSPPAGTNG